ncbi:MAG: cation-efflux pump [Nitrososphaerota archaeon]|jgi:cation diffusion facilitator family transporter|nr:cation-efflux pump [Nitrososphaerota archaeon]
MPSNNDDGQTKLKALKISAIAISSVVIVELVVGLYVNSLAIISDGLHAMLDAFTCVMLFFTVRESLKPPDEEHTYGHEKFESIGGLIGGIILIAVAVLIFYEAALRLMENAQLSDGISYVGFVAIGYALCISILRVTIFKRNSHVEGASMKAGFYDAISDLGSTLIALFGFALALLGFSNADALASIFLGVMLIYLSIKLAKSSIMELSDTASKELVEKTRRVIQSCDNVIKIECLKVRKVGSKVFVDVSVQVPNVMSLEDAHASASKIETCLKDACGNVDATIHVEPADKEHTIKQLIEKLAAVEGVREVHEIAVSYVDGKLYITLHACVNSELSVEDAHRLAEVIEQRLHHEIAPLENVTVHMEPTSITIPQEQINETRMQKIVTDAAMNIGNNLQIKRVMTYTAENKRYINIDCCFTNNVPIKDAHNLASLLEKETKEHFANAVVTVHIEPKQQKQ